MSFFPPFSFADSSRNGPGAARAPWYRGLPTRLSTEDLALLIMRLPSTPARGWMETALEMLSRGRPGQADTAR